VGDGQRESKLSYQELPRDLKQRRLTHAPKVAIGDGVLGFWVALDEEYPQTRGQRCWVHKTANVLDKLPKERAAPSQEPFARHLPATYAPGR